MNKQFTTPEISKQLKDLGFNEPCFCYYYDKGHNLSFHMDAPENVANITNSELSKDHNCICYSAPLWQQVIDWFREKHKLHIIINIGHDEDFVWYHEEIYKVENTYDYDPIELDDEGESGEDFPIIRERAILKAIDLIKEKPIEEEIIIPNTLHCYTILRM